MTTPVGSLTAAEIAMRVKRQFGDEAGAQITDDDILRWINDATRDIAQNNDLLQTKVNTPSVMDQADYTLPNDILTMRSVKFKGISLKGLSMQEADEYVVGHENVPAKGMPSHYWKYAGSITLYPAPDNNGDSLTVYYTRQPAPITTMIEIPELPPQYHNRIVEYCIAQALELDSDQAGYTQKMAIFQSNVDKLRDNSTWDSQDFYPSITSIPEDVY